MPWEGGAIRPEGGLSYQVKGGYLPFILPPFPQPAFQMVHFNLKTIKFHEG
jgi:hypothetical protein